MVEIQEGVISGKGVLCWCTADMQTYTLIPTEQKKLRAILSDGDDTTRTLRLPMDTLVRAAAGEAMGWAVIESLRRRVEYYAVLRR